MRMATRNDEEEKDGSRQDQYAAAPQEMRPEALHILPKAATANCSSLLIPCSYKNVSHPLDYIHEVGGGGLGQIRMGCLYELNHNLQLSDPSSLPVQLRSARVVMVIAKTEVSVIVRFPSITSLYTHFNNTNGVAYDDRDNRVIQYQHALLIKKGKLCGYPELDEEYVMSLEQAGKLLIREILSSEFSKHKHLKRFWTPTFQQPILASTGGQDHTTESEHVDDQHLGSFGAVLEEEEEDNQEEEDSHDEQNKPTRRATRSSATAAGSKIKIKNSNPIKKKRRIKNTEQSNKDNQIVVHNKKQLVSVTSYDRWSKERYRKAEVSMLQIMKEKDAVAGKPVMRRVPRMEARKYIGDTSLLDHLLNHMSGEVAPAGELRSRGPHTAEEEKEYWAEIAKRISIMEAGSFLIIITHPNGYVIGTDSRTTIGRDVMVDGVSTRFREMLTVKGESGGLEEERSLKMAFLNRESKLVVASAGNRLFNALVITEMSTHANCTGLTAYQVAIKFKETMNRVRKREEFRNLVDEQEEVLKSAFIIGMIEGEKPRIWKVALRNEQFVCVPCERYAFSGDIDEEAHDHITKYLEAKLTPGLSVAATKELAHECIVLATEASERKKVGDALIGGWSLVWVAVFYQDGAYPFEMGRIPGSGKYGD